MPNTLPGVRVHLGNSRRVSRCHDQRRLIASSPNGRSDSGRTVWTVSRRIAFTGDNRSADVGASVGRASGAKVHYLAPGTSVRGWPINQQIQVPRHLLPAAWRALPSRSLTPPQILTGRIPILDVEPVVEGGSRPAKAAEDELITVGATVFREGHDLIGVEVVLVDPSGAEVAVEPMHPVGEGMDRWEGAIRPGPNPASGRSLFARGPIQSRPGCTVRRSRSRRH